MGRLIHFCLALARAILSDTRVRRQWIFFSTLLVLLLVFGGYYLGGGFFGRHAVFFALYLLASFAGLLFLMLFALFDMLIIRRQYLEARRAARRELAGSLAARGTEADPPGPGGPPAETSR